MVETAHKYGKFAGTVSLPGLKECYDEGFDLVNCGADVAALSNNCAAIMQQKNDYLQ